MSQRSFTGNIGSAYEQHFVKKCDTFINLLNENGLQTENIVAAKDLFLQGLKHHQNSDKVTVANIIGGISNEIDTVSNLVDSSTVSNEDSKKLVQGKIDDLAAKINEQYVEVQLAKVSDHQSYRDSFIAAIEELTGDEGRKSLLEKASYDTKKVMQLIKPKNTTGFLQGIKAAGSDFLNDIKIGNLVRSTPNQIDNLLADIRESADMPREVLMERHFNDYASNFDDVEHKFHQDVMGLYNKSLIKNPENAEKIFADTKGAVENFSAYAKGMAGYIRQKLDDNSVTDKDTHLEEALAKYDEGLSKLFSRLQQSIGNIRNGQAL